MGAPASDTVITKTAFTSQASIDFGAASGFTSSGNLSAMNGPWYVERQALNVTYLRVPTQRGASGSIGLDQVTTTNGSIEKTELIYFANVNVEARVVNMAFNTSSAQQAQLFQINAASGDPYGRTYGVISASTMGPMGTIITSRPFISRTLYTGASSQPIYNKTAQVSNWAAYHPPAMQGATVLVDGETINAGPLMYDYPFHKDDGCLAGTHRSGHPFNFAAGAPTSYKVFNDYTIPGAFATSKEGPADIQAFIDGMANNIASETLHQWPISNETTVGNITIPAQDSGIAEYDINRHT